MDFHKRDTEVDVTSVLRILSALEDSLGSLGPAVNKILAKSLSLEQSRPGTSRVMMEVIVSKGVVARNAFKLKSNELHIFFLFNGYYI